MKGWKTVIFNLASVIFGVLESADFINLIAPDYQGYVIAIVGAVNIYLRAQTNTPIGSKE